MSNQQQQKQSNEPEVKIQDKIQQDLETEADNIFGGEGAPTETGETEKLKAEKDEVDVSSGKTDEEKGIEGSSSSPARETPPGESDKDEDPEGEKGEKKPEDEDELTAEDLDTRGMKAETAKKFEKLTGSNAKLKEKLTAAEEKLEKQDEVLSSFRDMVQQTGLGPHELERTLKIGGLIRRDPAKAAEVLHNIAADLAKKHGVAVGGVDLLEGFDDLTTKVREGEISRADAEELAKVRRREAVQEEERRTQEQRTQQESHRTARIQKAGQEIAQFLAVAEKDVNFAKIAKRLENDAAYAAKNLEPEQWLGYIKQQHQSYLDLASQFASSSRGYEPPITEGSGGGEPVNDPKDLGELADKLL